MPCDDPLSLEALRPWDFWNPQGSQPSWHVSRRRSGGALRRLVRAAGTGAVAVRAHDITVRVTVLGTGGNVAMRCLKEMIWDSLKVRKKCWRLLKEFECMYPPTPADARGSAPGNKTFDSCRTTTTTATATATTATPTTTTTTTGPFWKPDACSLEPPNNSCRRQKKRYFF